MPIFDHKHPKIIKVIFIFPKFASAYKKSAQFIHSILRYSKRGHKVGTPTFDHSHPIIISYPEFVSPFKKSVYSIDSFMRCSQFKSSVTRVVTPIFDNTHPNMFLSILNFWYQYAKSRLFHHFILEIYLIKKSYNLIVKGRFAFGPVWLRNKLIDLLLLPLAKKMKKK